MAAGGGIGAAVGHIKGRHEGLRPQTGRGLVAGTLAKGQAGLIVVYAANVSEQINAAIKAENKYVSEELNVGQAVLDKQIAADASGS